LLVAAGATTSMVGDTAPREPTGSGADVTVAADSRALCGSTSVVSLKVFLP
jgi:hypothetical protein